MTLSSLRRKFFGAKMSDKAHNALYDNPEVEDEREVIHNAILTMVEDEEETEMQPEQAEVDPVELSNALQTTEPPVIGKLEQIRNKVQEGINQYTLETLDVLNDPVAAVSQAIVNSNLIICKYEESMEITIAEHHAKLEAVEAARQSKQQLDSIEINNREARIRDYLNEIDILKEEIASISNSAISRNENFDKAIVDLNETHEKNMSSYEQLISAEKSKINSLSSSNSEPDKAGVVKIKSKKKSFVQGLKVDEIAKDTKSEQSSEQIS